MYAGIIAEGVPERFAEILRRLDEPSSDGGNAMTLVLGKQHTRERLLCNHWLDRLRAETDVVGIPSFEFQRLCVGQGLIRNWSAIQ
jgi:hypothetical protein